MFGARILRFVGTDNDPAEDRSGLVMVEIVFPLAAHDTPRRVRYPYPSECEYVDDLVSKIGRHRFVKVGGYLHARDAAALATFTRQFNEIAAGLSAREYWRALSR